MRFRHATASDLPALAGCFEGSNALPMPPRVREALPALLRQLLASPAAVIDVFEDVTEEGPRVFSMAGGLFIRDDVVEAYLAQPRPAFVATILADLLDDRRPLLTLDEIRRANAGEGLTLAVFPVPLRSLAWDDPLLVQLRKLAPQAFVRSCGGYRLQSIYYEVFTDEAAAYLQTGGYRLLHDFSALAGTGFLGPSSRARMLRLTRADLPPGAMSMATQMFDPPPARLGLTLAEQRVVLRALDGASDRELAETLGLSIETVRSTWRTIYSRLADDLPAMRADPARDDASGRGLEKRRTAVEFLRQNMHELRPSLPRARTPAGSDRTRR
jgi:hypothetical protein